MSDTGKTLALINATLPGVTGPKIIAEVDDWLGDHISNPSSPPLDTSLSLSEAAAPANLVGDLKSALGNGFSFSDSYTGDLNSAVAGCVKYGSGASNKPSSNSGFLITIKKGSSTVRQIAVDDSNHGH